MPKMKKKIYLAKANHKNANHKLIEISGSEFYRIVSDSNAENMEPRYFMRLTDDIDYECPEIFVEVPFDDALLFLYSKAEEDSEALTETQVASVLHISQPAVHKRKKKILEKMKSFWL